MLLVGALRDDPCLGEITLEASEAFEREGADAVDAEGECELLAGARLVVREDRRGGLEEGIAAGGEARRVGAIVEKRHFLGEPADIDGLEAGVKCIGRDIEEGCAGAAAEIFVTTSDYKISSHGGDIDGDDTDGVIGIDEEARAVLMACIGEAIEIGNEPGRW